MCAVDAKTTDSDPGNAVIVHVGTMSNMSGRSNRTLKANLGNRFESNGVNSCVSLGRVVSHRAEVPAMKALLCISMVACAVMAAATHPQTEIGSSERLRMSISQDETASGPGKSMHFQVTFNLNYAHKSPLWVR